MPPTKWPLSKSKWLERFVHAPWLHAQPAALIDVWRSWAAGRGAELLSPLLEAQVHAEFVRVARRKLPLSPPETPPLLDAVLWVLGPQRWSAINVVIEPKLKSPAELSFTVDSIQRSQLGAIGLSDHSQENSEGIGKDALQIEFDLRGHGFIGQRGRRWQVGSDLLGVDEQDNSANPYYRGPHLPPDLAHFLSQL